MYLKDGLMTSLNDIVLLKELRLKPNTTQFTTTTNISLISLKMYKMKMVLEPSNEFFEHEM